MLNLHKLENWEDAIKWQNLNRDVISYNYKNACVCPRDFKPVDSHYRSTLIIGRLLLFYLWICLDSHCRSTLITGRLLIQVLRYRSYWKKEKDNFISHIFYSYCIPNLKFSSVSNTHREKISKKTVLSPSSSISSILTRIVKCVSVFFFLVWYAKMTQIFDGSRKGVNA